MRFKLDECVPKRVATIVASRGHDAATTAAEGLSGSSDLEIIAACLRERRVLITFDTDFGNVVAYPVGLLDKHPGVVLLRPEVWTLSAVAAVVNSFFDWIDATKTGVNLQSNLVIVEPGNAVRFRGHVIP